jgi:hypothetical protein
MIESRYSKTPSKQIKVMEMNVTSLALPFGLLPDLQINDSNRNVEKNEKHLIHMLAGYKQK